MDRRKDRVSIDIGEVAATAIAWYSIILVGYLGILLPPIILKYSEILAGGLNHGLLLDRHAIQTYVPIMNENVFQGSW